MVKTNNTLRIDLHGKYVDDAMNELRNFIANAPKNTEKIIVIHGYNSGTALQEAVRHRLRGPRILEITGNFGNDGESIIWLKRN